MSIYTHRDYLSTLRTSATVAEVYHEDPLASDALNALIPEFEYPDWSHRTIGQVLAAIARMDEPPMKPDVACRMAGRGPM